ncbi:MAG: phosphoenolpyruvate carboxykinase (GTP) [Bacilli bacterium]|nr:phosphoenolpyruvate carboxykinase (GTP) [Bacilli bacterium]MBN2877725.1 phosphoenolpyruvate carboxykinase (GTP) [Bacilli bacterium]
MTKNKVLKDWIEEIQSLCQPDVVVLWEGSQTQYDDVAEDCVRKGKAIRLNPKKRPNSLLFRSDPSDVARVEKRTFISTTLEKDAGPTNNWISPDTLKPIMLDLYKGCMRGRTMYIIPFSMGPIGHEFSKLGVEITDSPYVALNMHIMTRSGMDVLKLIDDGVPFVKALHSVGHPLNLGDVDPSWPSAPMDHKYITQFPEENMIWSYGSGYGGNALLGKKCFALRIASNQARNEGWMAEHMLILKLTDPNGKTNYITGAFPSACGKTNLAMIKPSLPGWKAETCGDDIAWMRIKEDGRLYAINPENGFFGVTSGTSESSNPIALASVRHDTIFTNTALTDDMDVWWEDLTEEAPDHLIDWQGNDWYRGSSFRPDHPNARFTSPLTNCPVLAKEYEEAVPISAILFGGRRPTTIPLIHQSLDFLHGIFIGSIMGSQITAAVLDEHIGDVRRDPFAMLPFIGYNIKDYVNHWVDMYHKSTDDLLPKIFFVNWFRRDESNRYIWPGFGENSRILKWILERTVGKINYQITPIGLVPDIKKLDLTNLKLTQNALNTLFEVNKEDWIQEIHDIESYYSKVYSVEMPCVLRTQLANLKERFEI